MSPGLDPSTTGTPQRCSDAERERASAVVREAAANGRLTMDELEERLSTIYAARYRHELAAASADLQAAVPHAGWGAVLAMAWHQLSGDMRGLFARGGTTLSPRRRVVLALAVVAVALLLVALVTMFVHGVVDDGPERHEFGGD